jgi:alcohol dehydrogenase class IV
MTRHIEMMFNTRDVQRHYFPGVLVWGRDARNKLHDLIGPNDTIALFVDCFFHNHPFAKELAARYGNRLVFTEVCTGRPKAQRLIEIAMTLPAVPDVVVSIGGGSTSDAAKAVIGQWIFGTIDGVGMGAKRAMPRLEGSKRPLLVGIPTTAGTGADASRYYVTYDAVTDGKVHGKTWDLIADWIIIDAEFLRSAPLDLLVISAFDAFLHFFEGFICRGERSSFGDMMALDCISRIIRALHRAMRGDLSDEVLLELQYAAAVGGVAISNIRTGNIHEAAGALLEGSRLAHADTLMVFFAPAYRQYREAIAEREKLLMSHLAIYCPEPKFRDFGGVIAWWTDAFARTGRDKVIAGELTAVKDWAALEQRIFDRVNDDRVWCEKESPLPLDTAAVRHFVHDGLAPYRRP